MLKINKRLSVTLSIVITCLCIAVMLALAVTVHDYPRFWFANHTVTPSLAVMLFAYAELLFAFLAAGALLRLLFHIRKHLVFVPSNVSCLRGLSWCCVAEGLLFLAEGIVLRLRLDRVLWNEDMFILLAFLIAFACVFMGVILRVVKNAFEEAVTLKNENDFTI